MPALLGAGFILSYVTGILGPHKWKSEEVRVSLCPGKLKIRDMNKSKNVRILELLFKLIYETLADLRHGRRSGYRRMQSVSRMLAAALSGCEFSGDRSGALAETARCVQMLREEMARLAAEGACPERQRQEAEALLDEIERLTGGLQECEPTRYDE